MRPSILNHHSDASYRPAVDGMRAMAVMAVFLYHLNPAWLPGGFVGVDVFFVISGYVITLSILRDYSAKRFSLWVFYQRRIARIFPHALLVTLACLLVSPFIYSPEELGAVGSAAIAAAFAVANLKYAVQGSYFEFPSDIQPLLHFWSLGIEEQFYFFWPMILIGLKKRRASSSRGFMPIIVFLLISFLICLVLTYVKSAWAFYLTPARAWELLCGCLLAMLHRHSDFKTNSWVPMCQVLGITMVMCSFIFVGEHVFPGVLALFPVLGTMLMLGFDRAPFGWVERFLSRPCFIWIGKLSFALYLWHWPVFCLIDYHFLALGTFERMFLKTVVSMAFSLLGFYLVERPMRSYLGQKRTTFSAYAFFVIGVSVLLIIGLSVRLNQFTNINVSLADVKHGGYRLDPADPSGKIVLMGDSHAGMYGKTLVEIAEQLDLQCHIISVHSTNPLPGSALWEEYIQYLKKARPDIVLYVVSWGAKVERGQLDQLQKGIDTVLNHAGHVILLTSPPRLPVTSPRKEVRASGNATFVEDAQEGMRRRVANRLIYELRSERVRVIETETYFLIQDEFIPFMDEHGRQLFYDRGHLSYYGTSMLKESLSEAIQDLLK
jgi:peptidoglycan/LPS O-acetylase OafA/YrhL